MLLPVNEKPIIRTYSHHGYVNSIIDVPILFSIDVTELAEKNWNICADDLHVLQKGDTIAASSNGKSGKKKYYQIERVSETNDEISTKINQLKNIQRDAKIIFYISEVMEAKEYSDMNYSLTLHRYGYTTDKKGINCKNFGYTICEYPFVRMVRENRIIYFMCSKNNKKWKVLDKCILPKTVQNFFFGIAAINLDTDEYTEWLMSNYINLSFDSDADMTQVYLDYAMAPCKNMRYEYMYPSQFLDITYVSAKTIKWPDMADYIKRKIDNGYYVALAQDEFFIPNRKSYHKIHMFHHNLFWGYDNAKKIFCILGYGKTYSASCYSYEDFYRAGMSRTANLVLYRKDYNDVIFSFDKNAFLESLNNFLSGEVPYKSMLSAIGIRKMVYGMQVFKALSETNKGLWVSCFDNRAAYLFFEHSALWVKRVDFLVARGYLRENSAAKGRAKYLLEISEKLLFLVQKNMVGAYGISFHTPEELWNQVEADKIKEKTKAYLNKLEEAEFELINTVIREMRG